jgi:hypothetical protein
MVGVPLKEDMSAKELRQAAAGSSDANQARRLLALAAIRDGMSRQAAAHGIEDLGCGGRQWLGDAVDDTLRARRACGGRSVSLRPRARRCGQASSRRCPPTNRRWLGAPFGNPIDDVAFAHLAAGR